MTMERVLKQNKTKGTDGRYKKSCHVALRGAIRLFITDMNRLSHK